MAPVPTTDTLDPEAIGHSLTTACIITRHYWCNAQEWENDQRHGKGTFWVIKDGRLRKQYAGDWRRELPNNLESKRRRRDTLIRYKSRWKYARMLASEIFRLNGMRQTSEEVVHTLLHSACRAVLPRVHVFGYHGRALFLQFLLLPPPRCAPAAPSSSDRWQEERDGYLLFR